MTNLVRANIQTNNFIEEAMDLIEEDVNGTVINEGEPEDEVSDEEDTRKNTLAPSKQKIFKEDYSIPKIMWEIEAVPDWGHRIAAYTEDQKRFYNEMVPKINEIKGIMNSASGWDLLVDSKNDQVKIETKRSIRGNNLMRAQGPIDWTPEEIWRCMCYKPLRQEWDINNDYAEFTKKIGVNAFMYYNKTKKKFVISARDFATNYLINIEEEDGTLIVCGSSLNPHEEIPEKSGIVRGATPISGWVIKPNPQNPKTSYCFNMNELDLKAPIPDFAMR